MRFQQGVASTLSDKKEAYETNNSDAVDDGIKKTWFVKRIFSFTIKG